MRNIIEIKNVSFSYDDKEVLKNVSLDVRRGEFLAIIGANGSGKSTLAKHMNAVLVPSSGTVLVEDMDTADEQRMFDIRETVGMVFQNPDNQIVASVVEEDVAFALENLGTPPDEIRKRVDEALDIVGMREYALSAPYHLSGGQKQRVAIAGVLAMRPDCIVMDEPTAMLDPKGRRRVIETIEDLNKNHGITVVLITHYMEDAARADRIVVMSGGRAVIEGTPREVFSDSERIKALGLDVPPAAELCRELKRLGADVDPLTISPSECVEEIMKLFS